MDAGGDRDAWGDFDDASEPAALVQTQSGENAEKRAPTIRRGRGSMVSGTSKLSELSSALTRARTTEAESNRTMHDERMSLKRMQFSEAQQLEEWRIVCAEEKTRCRVKLLRAQARKEEVLAKKEEVHIKAELALSRKRLRDEGSLVRQEGGCVDVLLVTVIVFKKKASVEVRKASAKHTLVCGDGHSEV
ncbi:hypothetical protein PybrP1_010696 [[Pythium] brassicae (nom. inval.)]|nr:hypothetical protein PybrP1_010696 [[Pythium] brassicae (nom. inval.)]